MSDNNASLNGALVDFGTMLFWCGKSVSIAVRISVCSPVGQKERQVLCWPALASSMRK